MRTQRNLVDYGLRRRSVLDAVRRGLMGTTDVCDASPYLLQAAKYHGESTTSSCPLCRREELILVHWVYGDELGPRAGSARSLTELEALVGDIGEFTVYQVEVCRGCSWNFLVATFLMGNREPTPKPRRAAR